MCHSDYTGCNGARWAWGALKVHPHDQVDGDFGYKTLIGAVNGPSIRVALHDWQGSA
jgi:hypothetical protein